MLMHDYGRRRGGWPYNVLGKQVFLQSEIFLKQKATNNYLLHIFAISYNMFFYLRCFINLY